MATLPVSGRYILNLTKEAGGEVIKPHTIREPPFGKLQTGRMAVQAFNSNA